MSELRSLPGYDVQALLGSGTTGEVWRARELATGEVVALQRLPPGTDPAAVEALRSEQALLRSPYLVRLRAVVPEEDAAVLVLDHAAGGSLAALLARRTVLEPGEVVTIGVPLAAALAEAHASGLVHGDLTASSVLFTEDGMPLLSGLGVARVLGAPTPEPADAASDVRALAAVLHLLLTGGPPREAGGRGSRALVEAVAAGLAADPRDRPDAGAFAASLRRAHASAPVRLTGSAAPVREAPAARRRRPSSGQLAAAVLVVLVVAGAVAGWVSGRGDRPPPVAPLPAAAVAPDWPALLDELDAARSAAFADARPAALQAVWAPGSPGMATDAALVEQLAAAGRHALGLRHDVRSVEERSREGDRAELRVVDVLASYAVVDGAGAEVSRTPERGEQAFDVRLQRTAAGWRLAEVLPAQG